MKSLFYLKSDGNRPFAVVLLMVISLSMGATGLWVTPNEASAAPVQSDTCRVVSELEIPQILGQVQLIARGDGNTVDAYFPIKNPHKFVCSNASCPTDPANKDGIGPKLDVSTSIFSATTPGCAQIPVVTVKRNAPPIIIQPCPPGTPPSQCPNQQMVASNDSVLVFNCKFQENWFPNSMFNRKKRRGLVRIPASLFTSPQGTVVMRNPEDNDM